MMLQRSNSVAARVSPSFFVLLICCMALDLVPCRLEAAESEEPRPKPRVVQVVKQKVSKSLRSLSMETSMPHAFGEVRSINPIGMPGGLANATSTIPQTAVDSALDLSAGFAPSPSPFLSFEGVANGFGVVPPDPNGDVGKDHYVQWVNLGFEIFDKTTGVSVLGPVLGNVLWAGFGGDCEVTNDGDPIVLYDALADRWFMSQFAWGLGNGHQCIAISTTGDPTGSYYLYDFLITPGGVNDYPKFGIGTDAYFMMAHEFPGGTFSNTAMVAFDRDKMLVGDPTAIAIEFEVAPDTTLHVATLPANLEGLRPAPVGSPGLFVQAVDSEEFDSPAGSKPDRYNLWRLQPDFDDPPSSTLTMMEVSAGVPEFDTNLCLFDSSCIPQPDTSIGLDSIAQFTMYRAVYRNFGTHDALLVSQTVDADGFDTAGIRWVEIRDPFGTPTVFQTGTHSPDSTHRWMGSIAMDGDGNIALGYSASSDTTYPSIRYAGRLSSDPAGTLPQTEVDLAVGTGSQTHPDNRWGDYSSMSVDEYGDASLGVPPDCAFWYTNEYINLTGLANWQTRIGAFQFGGCLGTPLGTLQGTVTDATTSTPITGATVQVGGFWTTTDGSGTYSFLMPDGDYSVTASSFGYVPLTVSSVTVVSGATTTADFSLGAKPLVPVSGTVVDGSLAGWPLYARIDVSGGQSTQTFFTHPVSGQYGPIQLFEGESYLFHVTAEVPGYLSESRPVVPPSGGSTEDFSLPVAPSCTAPGYNNASSTLVSESFENSFPPADWNVQMVNGICFFQEAEGWNTANYANRPNTTGGTGKFAIADSNYCQPYFGTMDTSLETPLLDLSALDPSQALQIEFKHDFAQLFGGTLAADVDVWDGAVWHNVVGYASTNSANGTVTLATAAANGSASAKVRFRYRSGWEDWWKVDDVILSTASCQFTGGGLVSGNVSDAFTTAAINGVTISAVGGNSTTTMATPNDSALDDGFYLLHVPSGSQTLSATFPGYIDGAANLVISDGLNQQLDFGLLPENGLKDELASDFGDRGLWHYDMSAGWDKTTSWNAESMVGAGNAMFVDFGLNKGIWEYASGWTKQSSWDPYDLTAWGSKLTAAFDAGRGLWILETGSWTQLTTWEPQQVTPAGETLYGDFGPGRGIWAYESASGVWDKISSWDPFDIVRFGTQLVAAFDAGRGIWSYDGASWTRITEWEHEQMLVVGTALYADFGSGRGIWAYDTTSRNWTKRSSWDPYDMTVADSTLVAAFDAGRGVWRYASGSWTRLTTWEPEPNGMIGISGKLIAAFGASRGMWSYDLFSTTWTRITTWGDPEGLATVNINP